MGLILEGAPLPILVAYIVWLVRFITSQQKGERLTLKWRDMDLVRKTVSGLIIVWAFFSVYLSVGNELALLNVAFFPLSWVYSIARPVPIWSVTGVMVGLAVFFQLRFPRRPVAI